MSTDIRNLSRTIVPKSDQLNAEQLLAGPMTITITDVRVSDSAEQPVIIHYAGEEGRPYKPCKSMRRVMIFGWGEDGREWIGRSLTLYNDTSIKWGGEAVGGLRISHMSHIEKDIRVALTLTRGKKSLHDIKRMKAPEPAKADPMKDKAANVAQKVANGEAADVAATLAGLKKEALDALWSNLDAATQDALNAVWPEKAT